MVLSQEHKVNMSPGSTVDSKGSFETFLPNTGTGRLTGGGLLRGELSTWSTTDMLTLRGGHIQW